MDVTQFAVKNLNDLVVKPLQIVEYEKSLKDLGYTVTDSGKVFDFTGKMFAHSEEIAHAKLETKKLFYRPTRITASNSLSDAMKNEHFVTVGGLIFFGEDYEVVDD